MTRKIYHIKMTHKGKSPAMFDNSESTIVQGFDDGLDILKRWQEDTWDYYSKRFDELDRETLDRKCLNTLRECYNNSIRNFNPEHNKIGSVYVLSTVNGYDIAIHYNALTIKELDYL